jgi:tetratricopeptide (TPR) repeat protein
MNSAKAAFMEQANLAAAASDSSFEEKGARDAKFAFMKQYYTSAGVGDELGIAQRMLDDWLTNADTACKQLMESDDKSARGLVATVRLVLRELDRLHAPNAKACRQLLSILALCPSSNTPWSFFLGHCDDSVCDIEVFTRRQGLEMCAAALQRSGLVHVHNEMFFVHQLLQLAVKREVSDGVDAAAKLIDGRVGGENLSAVKAYRELLPVAYHVVKEVMTMSAVRREWCRHAGAKIADVMKWLGGGSIEVEIRRRNAEYAKTESDENAYFKALETLAESLQSTENYEEALGIHDQVLAFRRRVLPADHPDIAKAMQSSAVAYSNDGRRVKALDMFEQVLAIRRRVLLADHPDIVISMNNLAAIYREVGRHADALDMFEQVLAFQRRVLPADHPDIADGMHKLAASYCCVGRHADALDMFEQVLAFRRRVLPADHPDIAKAMKQLAAIYREVGRHADALDMFEQVLYFLRRVLPADMPVFAEAMSNIAISYSDVGRHADALDMFEQVLAFQRRVLPADHPYIVDSMVNLAVSYHNAGRHAEASLLQKQVILFRPPNFSR